MELHFPDIKKYQNTFKNFKNTLDTIPQKCSLKEEPLNNSTMKKNHQTKCSKRECIHYNAHKIIVTTLDGITVNAETPFIFIIHIHEV